MKGSREPRKVKGPGVDRVVKTHLKAAIFVRRLLIDAKEGVDADRAAVEADEGLRCLALSFDQDGRIAAVLMDIRDNVLEARYDVALAGIETFIFEALEYWLAP